MDFPATQAMDDEDFIPTQQLGEEKEPANTLVGILLISNETHSIFSGTTTIGRLPDCTIRLNDETVSKRHAEIEAESADKAVFIKDLGSSNKTKINDTKLRPDASYQIKDNDKLSFGKISATFKIHRAVDDSLIAGTPQVDRRGKAVIPDTPDSMNNSSVLEGDVSTIPGTQADENDSCFRRPQIPVRNSLSNEHESPKHLPFVLDDVPSPLSNNKDKESDISEVETQKFNVDNTKEMTNNSICNVETQKAVISRKSNVHFQDNEDKRTLNNSSVKKVLSEEFEKQSLEDVETQAFVCATSDSSSRKSVNTSIYSAETQKVCPDENNSVENAETQPFLPPKSSINNSNLADVSIHSAPTQKVQNTEAEQLENLDTQPFIRNSLGSDKRKSSNVSIHSAPTQKVQNTELEDEQIESLETQPFTRNSLYSDKRKSTNVSIHSAPTQKVQNTEPEEEQIQNLDTQPFTRNSLSSDKRKSANVSIHSASTQKVENTEQEDEQMENLDTQPFNRNSLCSDKRKSANVSIYSAETQKVVADVSNQSLENIETQRFTNASDCSKEKSADVSIYSAATQKIGTASDKGAIEDLETQKFNKTRASLSSKSYQCLDQEKMASSLSFSIQDIDTMPFTRHELPLGEKSSNSEVPNSDILSDCVADMTKPDDNEVGNSENDEDEKSDSTKKTSLPTPSKKSDKSQTNAEIDEAIVQNPKQMNDTLSKSLSKSLLQNSSKFERSKCMVESDDEEEIFSQNLIENAPFCLALDDSKNDSKDQSAVDLPKDVEHENDKTIDSECNDSLKKTDNSLANKSSIKKKSTIVENNDSETDEEGAFSSHLSEEKENEKSHKETGNDSETDEEGAFSSHLSEEKGEQSNSKPEADSETDEEGVFSGHLSKDSKEMKSSNSSRVIEESESEDEGVFSNNLSKNKSSRESVGPDENLLKSAENTPTNNSVRAKLSLNKLDEIARQESPALESDDDIFNENDEEKKTNSPGPDKADDSIAKDNFDSVNNSTTADNIHSESHKNVNGNNDVHELAPTQILETEDISLAPTQIVNTRRVSVSEEEVDELAPTQLIETQDAPSTARDTFASPARRVSRAAGPVKEITKEYDDMDLAPTQLIETQDPPSTTKDTFASPARTVSRVPGPVKEITKEYDDMDLAPTQKLVETQECTESLAPTQKVVDTQACSEEMGALQFSESMAPTQIIEHESNNVETEIATSPKATLNTSKHQMEEVTSVSPKPSPNISKRQLEEVEITSNKKMKTAEVPQPMEVDLNCTVEQNLNKMFEGPEEKVADSDPPIETQQLENILESSQIEENSATSLDVSVSQPSPTLSTKRSNIRGKNRRSLMRNKSGVLNTTNKSVVNLNDTIEKNLNDLFENNAGPVETSEPEPMLTQQLENVLNSSQDSNPVENKEEEARTPTVVRKKSRLSLSFNLNSSKQQAQNEKEECSPIVQSKENKTTSPSSLKEKSPQKEDYSANLEDKKDDAIDEQISSKNDKDIVYRRGTIGFTDDLEPVSTFDRVAFLEKYSSTDSQSDGDDIFKLKSPSSTSSKTRLSLKNVGVNLTLSSTSEKNVESKKINSPQLSAKKTIAAHPRSARKRNPVVRLSKLASPLYRKYAKPAKRVMACGTLGFTMDLQPVEGEELVSAASTESEDDLLSQMGKPSPKINKEDINDTKNDKVEEPVVDANDDQPTVEDSPMEDENDSEDDMFKELPDIKIAGTVDCPATSSQLAAVSDRETDSDSIKSVKVEIPDRWKWYAEKRYDVIYDKYKPKKKKSDTSESENDEDEEIEKNNVTEEPVKDDREERSAAIDQILAKIGADKVVPERKSKRVAQNNTGKENVNENVVTTRSRRLKKVRTPSPEPTVDDGEDSDKTNEALSSSSDNESTGELSILPKYRPVSPLRLDLENLSRKRDDKDDEDDSEPEFQAPRCNFRRSVNRAKAKTSPLNNTRRRLRKSACNNDNNDLTQYHGKDAVNKKTIGASNVGTVDKDGLVFQVSRDSKTKATTTTSRTSASTTNRTKRIIDSEDDDESTSREPSSKRAKTLVDRQKLQQVTVVISPLRDKLLKLSEANRLNIANVSSNFKQPKSTLEKAVTKAPNTLDGYVSRVKTARTDSSDLSAVENSIVEDKDESQSKSKIRGKPAARTNKAKVDTSSERNANSSKENLEESDIEKQKTRGRGRRNQITDSSVSDKASSQDEVSASSVENKSTRSTRGKFVRQNQLKKQEAKTTKQQSKVIKDSDSEEEKPEKPTITVRKTTRGRQAKTVNKSGAVKKDITDIEDSDSEALEKPTTAVRKTTRGRQAKTVDKSGAGKKDIKDSDSEAPEKPATAVKKTTRGRQAKTVDKSGTGKKDIADSENDKIKDEDSESQSSSQSKSTTARATRTRKNTVNQELDSGSSEAPEAATSRGNRKRAANEKPDFVVKVTKVDSNTKSTIKSDETKDEQTEDEEKEFKLEKKKINVKLEEPTKAPVRKTRTRATKNTTATTESSSEESLEVSEIMKSSVLEDSKTTTRRRGRAAAKSSTSYVENTESSDDVFEKPTSRPKRARITKADKSQSSQASDAEEDTKSTQPSQKSTRRKHSPSPSPTPPSDASLTPSRISRLSMSPSRRPRVLFTGEKSDAHRNMLKKLGGVETEEFNSCSVLITDKVRRTFKFLCSLAQGIPIASVKWLDDSKKANRFLDLEDYILNDPEAEAKFQFNLKESLDKARKHKMLEGYTILLAPKIKQPPIAELKDMVISSGGKPILRAPAKWPEKCVVVTTEQELDSAKKLIAKAPKSVTVQSIEFILTGILRQDANLNEFKLLG